jgi:hypothetical protein
MNDACPECGTEVNTVVMTAGYVFEPGDWCVCVNCAAVLRLNADLRLRSATRKEKRKLPRGVALSVKAVQAQRRPGGLYGDELQSLQDELDKGEKQ